MKRGQLIIGISQKRVVTQKKQKIAQEWDMYCRVIAETQEQATAGSVPTHWLSFVQCL